MKKRDGNIIKHIKREINLSTRSESIGKKKYSRKVKHPKSVKEGYSDVALFAICA